MQNIREGRHRRVRKKIRGTAERPRLSVYRSLTQIYAQLIDDVHGHTLISASTLSLKKGIKIEKARECGKAIAKQAKEKGIKNIVFDRSGYKYHGRIKAVAEGAREAGLEF